MKLVGGGSVINGATLSSLVILHEIKICLVNWHLCYRTKIILKSVCNEYFFSLKIWIWIDYHCPQLPNSNMISFLNFKLANRSKIVFVKQKPFKNYSGLLEKYFCSFLRERNWIFLYHAFCADPPLNLQLICLLVFLSVVGWKFRRSP